VLPKELKDTTTIALRKLEKGNYLLVNTYRPIVLKNTLVKLVKIVVAKHLIEVVEKHNLLS
jgi:hypothetical protein